VSAWHAGLEPVRAQKIVAGSAPARGPRDVYCYFDNTDVKLRAPFDAQSLMAKLGLAADASAQAAPSSQQTPESMPEGPDRARSPKPRRGRQTEEVRV
jgi:uncharacterized protein YecE (DUF72 family)